MLKLYNTLTRKKEALKLKPGKLLRLFVCGATVYDYAHLGHARTYLMFDAFVRFLRSQEYKVDYLQNITDIDDKIIKRAKEKRLPAKSLARMFEKAYLKDMKALGIASVDKYARATDHIPEIIRQIGKLLKKQYAYIIEGDGVYYDISKFKNYGKLSGRTTLQAQDAVSRIDESVKKRNKGDFALWKYSKPGEPVWRPAPPKAGRGSPSLRAGRPGWHIEDTAITEKRFGPQYELHGGAQDLIFPHHEAEIAQMEAISGKHPMARHWLHTGFLTVQGEKMAKSLGNFITIQDFLKTHSPRVLRLLVLKAHYRSPIDYSERLLFQTEKELQRVDEFTDRLKSEIRNSKSETNSKFKIQNSKLAFAKALEDDFNTPKIISVLFELVSKGNALLAKENMSQKEAKAILAFLKEADSILGFIFWGRKKQQRIPEQVQELVRQRQAHRAQGNWEESDALRKELQKRGWRVDDTPKGPRLKKIS